MAQNSKLLEIVIKARDEATDTLKGVSATLKKNEADLKAVAAASGVALAGIVGFGINAIKSASEAQAVQAQLNAVIKSTGGVAGVTAQSVLDLSSSLQKVTTYGDEAITSAQNMLLTFTNIGKGVFPDATKTVLDMSTALGQDLKSSAIQLGKSLNNPIDGITALTRVGVKFTDEQKAMITKLVEAGDVMGAQKIILNELAVEFGGSATAAASTFGGQVTQVKELVGDLNESIGMALIPMLNGLVGALKPIITNMIEWINAHPQLTAAIVASVTLVAGLTFAITSLSVALLAVQLAMGPIGWALLAIGAAIALTLIPTITLLIKHWDLLKEGAIQAFLNIGENLAFFIDMAVLKFQGWMLWLQVLWNDIKGLFKEAIDAIVDHFKPLIDTITGIIDMVDKLISKIKSVGSSLGKKISGARAYGGAVQTGKQYLVGEQGPELFTASSNGSIIPNSKLAGAGGLTIITNVNGGVYLDDNAAELIGDRIIQNFKRVAKI